MTQGSINRELSLLFPERTLESIKCQRAPKPSECRYSTHREWSDRRESRVSWVSKYYCVCGEFGGTKRAAHDGEGGQPKPTTQAAVTAVLAEITRQNVGKLCLSTYDVEELLGLAEPPGPSGQWVQALIDKEYHQWIQELPTPKGKQALEAQETCKSKSRGRRRNGKHQGESPRQGWALSRKQRRRKVFGMLQELYKKNRSRCAKTVLSSDWDKEKRFISLGEQESYVIRHTTTIWKKGLSSKSRCLTGYWASPYGGRHMPPVRESLQRRTGIASPSSDVHEALLTSSRYSFY